MPHDRRSFIRRFGITLGSLIASGSLPGCGPKKEGELSNTKTRGEIQKESSPTPRAPQWEQLRRCWLNLSNKQDMRNTLDENLDHALTQGKEPLTATRDILGKEHQAILDALVAAGQVSKPVAKHMRIAFEEAAYHVVRSMATCYIGSPVELAPYVPRKDLLQQADVLRNISGDLDSATVAKAQAAIAQDIAFLEILKTGANGYGALRSNYETGTLKASPEALEAARLLAQLFVERPG